MKLEPLEYLSAFLDGEEVEPAALAGALADPGAREALRDFVLLRAEVSGDESVPGPAAYREIRRTVRSTERATWWRRVVPVPAPALAAVIVIGVAVAIWAGVAFQRPAVEPFDVPPEPDRVLRFDLDEGWHPTGEEEGS